MVHTHICTLKAHTHAATTALMVNIQKNIFKPPTVVAAYVSKYTLLVHKHAVCYGSSHNTATIKAVVAAYVCAFRVHMCVCTTDVATAALIVAVFVIIA